MIAQTNQTGSLAPLDDQGAFSRAILANIPTGVMILTARDADGEAFGATVNSFASVALDPPTLLVSLHLESRTRRAVSISGAFVLNMLSCEQADLAMSFAGSAADHAQRFGPVRTTDVPEGVVLDDAIASFRCKTLHSIYVATHRLFVADVVEARRGAASDVEPLISYQRSLLKPSEHRDWKIK